MKRFLIYLFCFSLILQSMIGQFLFYTFSTHVLYTSTSSNNEHADPHFFHTLDLTKWEHNHTKKTYFVRDSVADHLFSPSNFPNEGSSPWAFTYFLLGNCFDLLIIEERISNLVHFYSTLFKNIQIGLPTTKMIYPHHNFY